MSKTTKPKLYFRETSRPEVFPIGKTIKNNIQQTEKLPMQISNTLRTNYSNGKANETYIGELDYVGAVMSEKNNMKIRRLTPTECERLQAFPDGWTEGISDAQRYKCLGNAVTTSVITEIGKRLYDIQNNRLPGMR